MCSPFSFRKVELYDNNQTLIARIQWSIQTRY